MLNRVVRGVHRRWRQYQVRRDPNRRQFLALEPAASDHRVDRNLLLTGLARSGTSLVSTVISNQPNAYCANEIFYNPDELAQNLARVRKALVEGVPVPNRYDRDGKLTTDTRRDGARVLYRVAPGVFDADCLVASKANAPYLNDLATVGKAASRIVAMVREPLFTLGSWNSPAVQYIPEYRVAPDDMHPRWHDIPFPTEDRIERQAFLWSWYARVIIDAAKKGEVTVVAYEDLADPGVDLEATFGLAAGVAPQQFENRNDRSRLESIALDRIEAAISAAGLTELYEELAEFSRSAHVGA